MGVVKVVVVVDAGVLVQTELELEGKQRDASGLLLPIRPRRCRRFSVTFRLPSLLGKPVSRYFAAAVVTEIFAVGSQKDVGSSSWLVLPSDIASLENLEALLAEGRLGFISLTSYSLWERSIVANCRHDDADERGVWSFSFSNSEGVDFVVLACAPELLKHACRVLYSPAECFCTLTAVLFVPCLTVLWKGRTKMVASV